MWIYVKGVFLAQCFDSHIRLLTGKPYTLLYFIYCLHAVFHLMNADFVLFSGVMTH